MGNLLKNLRTSRKPRLALNALLFIILLSSPTTVDAQSDSSAIQFNGTGRGIFEIVNSDECSSSGKCSGEIQGTFDTTAVGIVAGIVRFNFTDDWSNINAGTSLCSTPAPGKESFVWETEKGDGVVMRQSSGYVCPSGNRQTGTWKRILRADSGTGRFAGATGTLFISGRTDFVTGETVWSFEGSITSENEPQNGCYRAYLVGGGLLIPPKDTPPPGSSDFQFWLCGDDITISGPNPRKDYEVFNPYQP